MILLIRDYQSTMLNGITTVVLDRMSKSSPIVFKLPKLDSMNGSVVFETTDPNKIAKYTKVKFLFGRYPHYVRVVHTAKSYLADNTNPFTTNIDGVKHGCESLLDCTNIINVFDYTDWYPKMESVDIGIAIDKLISIMPSKFWEFNRFPKASMEMIAHKYNNRISLVSNRITISSELLQQSNATEWDCDAFLHAKLDDKWFVIDEFTVGTYFR